MPGAVNLELAAAPANGFGAAVALSANAASGPASTLDEAAKPASHEQYASRLRCGFSDADRRDWLAAHRASAIVSVPLSEAAMFALVPIASRAPVLRQH